MGVDGNQGTGGRLHLAAGGLALDIADGSPRRIRFHGTEVLRLLSYAVRDRNWGTLVAVIGDERHETEGGRLLYENRFASADGSFRLEGEAQEDGARIKAAVEIVPTVDLETNRAGFAILHPIAGVAGGALTVRHPDGSTTRTAFPEMIQADAPALEIAGLAHRVGPVDVDVAFSGDVFEMEDQRNWSDASYKTFCRPLARPCPFVARKGVPIRQEIRITLRRNITRRREEADEAAASPAAPRNGRVPRLCWTAELGATAPQAAARLPELGVALRLPVEAKAEALAAWRDTGDLTLEIVLAEGDDGATSLRALARTCSTAGIAPARVVALPQPCLKGLPAQPSPADILPALRAAFPQAAAGGGSLTLFTELNADPPDPALVDFITFGNAAIVHTADDESVIETLEALPHVFASATALAGGRPLRLGLVAIALRSNPYGEDVTPNPGLARLAMARRDPRQHERFAAAYAVGVLAAAATAEVESLSPAMPDGDLGVSGPSGLSPLFHVVRAAARLGGEPVRVTHGPGGLVLLAAGTAGIAANAGHATVRLEPPDGTVARLLDETALAAARADPLWSEQAPATAGPLTLAPFDVAFLSAS